MEDLVIEKELGSELKLVAGYKDGLIILSVVHEGKLGSVKLEGSVGAAELVDAITDLIPGETDDALLDAWAEKLLAKKTDVPV